MMAQVINIEHRQIEREKKAREEALRDFPWREMERIRMYILDSQIELWSEKKKIIVVEASFRLVYESFVFGIKEGKRRKLYKNLTTEEMYHRYFGHLECQIVQQVMDEFVMFCWLERRKRESLRILFQSLTKEWFIRGFKKKS